MKQQTAVEWLHYVSKQRELDKFDWEQAKEMEKQQIEIAFEQGMINSADYYIPQASGREIVPECENYYNETYKND
jgi:hypothetical protein